MQESNIVKKANMWTAINKGFPNTTFVSEQKSWRVEKFYGDTEPNERIKQITAKLISGIRRDRLGIFPSKKSENPEGDEGKKSAFDDLIKKAGLEQNQDGKKEQTYLVRPEQIIVKIPANSEARIFPRGLHCEHCQYYGIFKETSSMKSLTCPHCEKGNLVQPNLIFVCPRCGAQDEMMPPWKKLQHCNPGFSCTDESCNGNLFLRIGKILTRSEWICSISKENKSPLWRPCMNCSSPGNAVRMRLTYSTANYYRPLKVSEILDSDFQEFSVENIKSSWKLDDLPREERDVVVNYGIDDMQIIDELTSIDVTYGYTTHDERAVPQLFEESDYGRTQYECFILKTKGKGLLVRLNKKKIVKAVIAYMEQAAESSGLEELQTKLQDLQSAFDVSATDAYKKLAESTCEQFDMGSVSKRWAMPLLRLLHSFEHTLTYQAPLTTGLEQNSFQSKVFLNDCAILIYERDQVEAGGVEYLALKKVIEWLRQSRRRIIHCRHECKDGCASCLFINDPLCHPLLNAETGGSYMLPNSLLSRILLIHFWNLESIAPVSSTEADANGRRLF